MNRQSVTIFDVAKKAGVSVKTVSRVLNDEPRVRTNTRNVVLAAASDLKYQRNAYARGLRAENSNIYGLIYADATGGYHTDILHGVLTKCKAEGFHLIVELLTDGDIVQKLERFVAQVRLDGVVMTSPLSDNPSLLSVLADYGVATVRVSPRESIGCDLIVGIDDGRAAMDIVDYLVGLGHRRIGFVQGTPGLAATEQRYAGYRSALANHGLAHDDALVEPGHFDFETGESAGERLLGLAEPPTAIIASNDEAAAGVLAAASRAGVGVPDALSVCGFDDSMIARVLVPKLTTVRQPSQQMGSEAIAMLMQHRRELAEGRPLAAVRKTLQHEVVVRGSAAAVRRPA